MVITYYGKQYCKLTLGDLTIALNPPVKDAKAFKGKTPRFGADIALMSVRHSDYGNPETVTLGDKQPFVIDGPGSYEVHDCFITGAKSTVVIDGKTYINTVYGFELDNIKIGVVGAVAEESTFSPEAKELLANADMIFVPIGGGEVFDAAHAYKVATSFEPNVIVPLETDDASLARFLKEGGQEKVEVLDKATLKRKDLDGKAGYIIALAPQA